MRERQFNAGTCCKLKITFDGKTPFSIACFPTEKKIK